MNETDVNDILRELSTGTILDLALIVVAAACLIVLTQRLLPRLADRFSGRYRHYVLAVVPMIRLIVIAVAIALAVPLFVEPTLANLTVLLGTIGLGLGFALKDYVSSLVAGIVVLYEASFRPGDWIEVEDTYGEVRSIGMRAMEMVTPDDTNVVVPHMKLWNQIIGNANNGTQNLLCVADFYLEPEHEAASVRRTLHDVALTSPYLQLEQPIEVVVQEKPWGTHYRLKAYPIDPRDQFRFVSDLTVRGKSALREMDVTFATVSALSEEAA